LFVTTNSPRNLTTTLCARAATNASEWVLSYFSIGFAKKVLLADRLAELVNPIFASVASGAMLSFGYGWTAVLGFSLRIFLDFSAYTDMAIGIAMLFGLVLPENFRRPYLATNIRDFWRRWHISLSRFLRDYLYIPLGGSRNGAARAFAVRWPDGVVPFVVISPTA
jgi:alginate O-acetyltransferase complex protein AlgI